jgi:hydrogenase maturation protein HypF
MAEHGLTPDVRVLGFAFDGTGYGDDGAVWGGELLSADYAGYVRLAHVAYVDLPGGDAGVRNPCRMALSYLRSAGLAWADDVLSVRACSQQELALLDRQLVRGVGCVPTSSMGRLFDAVASLTGICHRAGYDAQPAMELEAAARPHTVTEGYPFAIGDGEPFTIDPGPVVEAVVTEVRAGVEPGLVAARFQQAVVDMVVVAAVEARRRTGLSTATLSGGVFLNAFLSARCATLLQAAGFEVLRHERVPASDAGIALGQVAVLAHHPTGLPSPVLERRQRPPEMESPCV